VNIPSEAVLLRVYLNASDRLHGKAVYKRVVETARAMPMAGASVFLVDFSYGTHRQIRDSRSDYLSFHIPVVVELVDGAERIGKLRAELDGIVGEGLVVARPVRVMRYAGKTQLGNDPERTVPERNPPINLVDRSSTTMKLEGEAQRVTVYIGNSDTWRGRNAVTAIIEKCREMGIAGATATLGVMGFGKTSRIHRAHLLGLSEDLPERIEIVDSPDRIAALLPVLDELIQGGLVVLEDVQVVRYQHDPKGSKTSSSPEREKP
jgi:PII-like signaling protein